MNTFSKDKLGSVDSLFKCKDVDTLLIKLKIPVKARPYLKNIAKDIVDELVKNGPGYLFCDKVKITGGGSGKVVVHDEDDGDGVLQRIPTPPSSGESSGSPNKIPYKTLMVYVVLLVIGIIHIWYIVNEIERIGKMAGIEDVKKSVTDYWTSPIKFVSTVIVDAVTKIHEDYVNNHMDDLIETCSTQSTNVITKIAAIWNRQGAYIDCANTMADAQLNIQKTQITNTIKLAVANITFYYQIASILIPTSLCNIVSILTVKNDLVSRPLIALQKKLVRSEINKVMKEQLQLYNLQNKQRQLKGRRKTQKKRRKNKKKRVKQTKRL